jgi:hypothetical protein
VFWFWFLSLVFPSLFVRGSFGCRHNRVQVRRGLQSVLIVGSKGWHGTTAEAGGSGWSDHVIMDRVKKRWEPTSLAYHGYRSNQTGPVPAANRPIQNFQISIQKN